MIWFQRKSREKEEDPAAKLVRLTLLDERQRIHAELERITRELDEQIDHGDDDIAEPPFKNAANRGSPVQTHNPSSEA